MKIAKIFLAVIALFTIACNNGGGDGGNTTVPATEWGVEGTIVGEWALTSWADQSEARPKVYIAFNEDNTFDLYQQQYSVVWFRFHGTYSLNGTTLTGSYEDGTPWACNYIVDYGTQENERRLKLTSVSDKADVAVYAEDVIPTEIIDEAKDPEVARSVKFERFL